MGTAIERRPKPAPFSSLSLAVGMVAACIFPACGQDPAAERAPSTTTSVTQTTTTSVPPATTSTIGAGHEPIPTDPATLESCSKLSSNATRTTPSRWWVAPPEGWNLSYAVSSSTPASDGQEIGASLLVRTGAGHLVLAHVTVTSVPFQAGDFTPEPSEPTLRGVPGSVQPETTRGGPTGALQANWIEDNQSFRAVGRGLDELEFRSVLDRTGIDGGVVTTVPGDWQLLGAGRSDNGPDATVLGFTARGGSLDEYGIAPVEVTVQDNASKLPGPGTPLLLSDKVGAEVTSFNGRPAVTSDLGDGRHSVSTVTEFGHPVEAFGPLPAQELLRLAGDTERIDPSDPRLVGVAIGNGFINGGACREDF